MAKIAATPVKSTTPVAKAIPRQDAKPHAADTSAYERAYERYQQAQADFMAFMGAPGWKRTLVAALSGLAIACGGAWAVGSIVSYLMVGALLATSSLFITMALGLVAAIWLSLKTGKLVGRVFGAVLTGEADERAIAAYDASRDFVAKCNPMRLFGAKPEAATVH